jgi:predicted ATPase/DNA-binding SARP family transcriptional activator
MARVLVLGPVRVRLDEHDVVPGGPRERAVLAALAAAGEAGIDHDRLVDLVWGDGSPRTAHRTAQAYLSRLRGLLGQESVLTVAGRHRLAGVSVDLWEFEELLSSARRTPATAPRDLEEALALWRDRTVAVDAALDGAAELLAAWERGRLDAQELLLAHLEDAAVPEAAERLLTEAPHRERAWGLLAGALHRLGRRDEALAALRRARRCLAEDLGIDLSADLEELEADLLRQGVGPGAAPPLPRPATRLVGRGREVDQVVVGLGHHRLVTLVGTGGIGKTRLALAVAGQLAARAPVFVARLAAVTSTRSVQDAVVEALDADVSDLRAAADRRFGRGPGYLVVDNCEHVLPAVAELVAELLTGPWQVRIVATSRTPLGVRGELLVDVPPLDVGSGDTAVPAVDLFLDRAREVTNTSEWGERERDAVADICRSLDGIPLALELAARRLRTLEVTELVDDLHAELRADRPGAVPGAEPRHRTLATALDWTYRALSDEEQHAFRVLGLLHGRLPLASAAAVVDGRPQVEGLLQQSLLTRTALGVGMYEPVRQYAVSLLTPEERQDGLARIADEVAAFTARATDFLVGPDEVDWMDRLDALHGDVRAVVEWAAAHGRHALLAGVVADVAYLWMLGWSPGEGRRWLDTALSTTSDRRLEARLLTWSAALAVIAGQPGLAREHGDRAVAAARPLDDPRLLGRALHSRALADKYGEHTARARVLLAEAHSLRLQAGDLAGAAMSLGAVADIDVNESLFDRAAEGYALGLPLMRSAGTARGLVAYLHSMAELELMRGDPRRADELAREALEPARRTRDTWHVGQLASVRAAAARDLHASAAEQRALTRAALAATVPLADPKVLLDVVEHVAGHLADEGRDDEALRLLVGAAGVREREQAPWSVPRRARRDADEREVRRRATLPDLGVPVDLAWLTAAAGDALR